MSNIDRNAPRYDGGDRYVAQAFDDIRRVFQRLDEQSAITVMGDGTWIDTATAGATVTVSHIGPDDSSPTAMDTITVVNNAGVVTITPKIYSYDGKGHLIEENDGTPVSFSLGAGGYIGDEEWIHLDGESGEFSHIGPSTAAKTHGITGDSWITASGAFSVDAVGHLRNSTGAVYTLAHAAPQAQANLLTVGGGNAWITGGGSISVDTKGHVRDTTESYLLSHADPQAASGALDTPVLMPGSVGFDSESRDLTITPQIVRFDAKGHRTAQMDGTPITVNIPGTTGTPYTADEVWITLDGTEIQHIGPDMVSPYTTRIAISQGDGLTDDGVEFDIDMDAHGHVTTDGYIHIEHYTPTPNYTPDDLYTGNDEYTYFDIPLGGTTARLFVDKFGHLLRVYTF